MKEKRTYARVALVIALLLGISGCSGTMNGMIRGTGERVSISYEQAMEHDNLVLTMPDGEVFTGKAVSAGNISGFGQGYNYETGSTFTTFNASSGNFVATLFGNKGTTMRCKLNYASSYGDTSGGGVGVCEASNGNVVDIQW